MEELLNIIKAHASRYPKMCPQDAVKLIYQNEFGGGHLIKDPVWSLNYIKEELSACGHDELAAQYEDIGNGVVRVNLKALRSSPEKLNWLFIQSAEAHRGDMESFLKKLELLRQNAEILPFPESELEEYLDGYIAAGCPMVSHSEEYREAYDPHYRVVLRSLIKTPEQEIEELQARVAALESRLGLGYQRKPAPVAAVKPAPAVRPAPAAKPAPEPERKPAQPVSSRFSESSVGKYGVGILAGILILLALAVGIRNYWETIPAIVKFSAILLIGIAVEAVGWINLRKTGRKNGFLTSVTGTGAAISFVALVAGNLAWGLYGLIPTGLLLIAWFIVNFLLAMRADSVVFYSVAYLGGVISVLLAALKLRDGYWAADTARVYDLGGQIGLIVIVAVIMLIGILLRRKNRVLPFMNYGFGLISSALIMFTVDGSFASGDGAMPLCAGLIAIGAVLIVEASRLTDAADNLRRVVNAVAALFAGFVAAGACVMFVDTYFTFGGEYIPEAVGAGAGAAITAGLTLALPRDREGRFLAVSPIVAVTLGIFSGGVLTMESIAPAFAAGLILALPIRKKLFYRIPAYIMLFISLWAAIDTYGEKDWARITTCALLLIDAALIYYLAVRRIDLRFPKVAAICAIPCAFIALIPPDFDFAWKLLFLAAALIAHRILFVDRDEKRGAEEITALILLHLCLIFLHLAAYITGIFDRTTLASALITAILIGLSATGVYEALRFRSWLAAIVYVLVSNLNVFILNEMWAGGDAQLIVSVAGILLSALFITLGFVFRHKRLRILGLITMLVYVLKITFFDLPELGGTGVNILLLFAGGLICFAISFAYNKLDKYFAEREGDTDEKTDKAI